MENKRVIEIIEDHESIVQTLNAIACAIENCTGMPNYIPMLHDTAVSDQLGIICEALSGVIEEAPEKVDGTVETPSETSTSSKEGKFWWNYEGRREPL